VENRLIPAFAAAAIAAIALMAACGGNSNDAASPTDFSSRGSSETSPSFATPGADPAKNIAAGVPATGDATGSSGGAGDATNLPSQLDRKVISNTTLALGVGDVGAVFNEAQQIARTNGGYTEKSSYSNEPADGAKQRSASLTLRVPAAGLDATMSALRGIAGARVTFEGANSTEITDQYTDLQSRLRNLERTEQSYLALLAQAKTVPDIITVNDRLDSVRGQIEQIQGRLNVYDNMVDLATIGLTIAPLVPANVDTGGPKGFQASFEDAWDWSTERARYLISGSGAAGAVAIWLALPVLLVFVAARYARRRGAPTHASPAGD
jgi:hypothetical protein